MTMAMAMLSTAAVAACPCTFSASRLPTRRPFRSSGNEKSLLSKKYTIQISRSSVISARAAVQELDMTKAVPQADRVLVRLEELPEKSVGGVLLPKSAVKFEHYLCGEVVSVGKEAGSICVGQKVLFSDLNAYEVNLGTSEKLCFVRGGDLLAVVE